MKLRRVAICVFRSQADSALLSAAMGYQMGTTCPYAPV